MQFGSGYRVDNMGDPAVSIVSPTTGFISSTRFYSLPSDAFPYNFITVTVQAAHFNRSQIELDENQLLCNWTDISDISSDGIVGYGCTAPVTAGDHVVSHLGENGVVSVIAYGWNANNSQLGYAYLTGINLELTAPNIAGNILTPACASSWGAHVTQLYSLCLVEA